MNDEIYILIYSIFKTKKFINILGKEFINNNRNKIKIIYNNKKVPLQSFFSTKEIKGNILKIKMILNKNAYNKSYMFKDCFFLSEIKIFNDIDFEEDDENYKNHMKSDKEYSGFNFINDNSMKEEYLNHNLEEEFNIISDKYINKTPISDYFYNKTLNIHCNSNELREANDSDVNNSNIYIFKSTTSQNIDIINYTFICT